MYEEGQEETTVSVLQPSLNTVGTLFWFGGCISATDVGSLIKTDEIMNLLKKCLCICKAVKCQHDTGPHLLMFT